jgi:hypothetical protein
MSALRASDVARAVSAASEACAAAARASRLDWHTHHALPLTHCTHYWTHGDLVSDGAVITLDAATHLDFNVRVTVTQNGALLVVCGHFASP